MYHPTRTEHISDNSLFGMFHSDPPKHNKDVIMEDQKLNRRLLPILEDTHQLHHPMIGVCMFFFSKMGSAKHPMLEDTVPAIVHPKKFFFFVLTLY